MEASNYLVAVGLFRELLRLGGQFLIFCTFQQLPEWTEELRAYQEEGSVLVTAAAARFRKKEKSGPSVVAGTPLALLLLLPKRRPRRSLPRSSYVPYLCSCIMTLTPFPQGKSSALRYYTARPRWNFLRYSGAPFYQRRARADAVPML